MAFPYLSWPRQRHLLSAAGEPWQAETLCDAAGRGVRRCVGASCASLPRLAGTDRDRGRAARGPSRWRLEFAVLGDHDADVSALVAAVRAEAHREIGRSYLEPASTGVGWQVAGSEVVGRIEVGTEGQRRVVVDGRSLSWEELGEALESFEGFRFRLIVEDRITDVRTVKE